MVLIWLVAKSRGSVLQELLMRSLILCFLMILLVLLMRMLENTCSRNSSGRQDFWGTELEFLWLIIYLTYIRLIGFFFLIMGRSLKMAHWRSFLRRVTLHPKTSVPSPPPDGVSSPPPPPIPSPHLTLPIPSMHLYYEKACSNVMVSSHFFVCPAPTSLSPRQLAHGLPAQPWNQNHGLKKNTENGRSHPPPFLSPVCEWWHKGIPQPSLESSQCTLNCWAGNIYGQTGRLIVL